MLNALAARRPLYVRRLPVFEELLESLAHTPNIRFYDTTDDLIRQLRHIAPWDDSVPVPATDNGAGRSAREIRAGLELALARIDYRRIVERVRAVQFPGQVAPQSAPLRAIPDEPAAFAAQFLAVRVERLARRLFDLPMLFAGARLIARAIRGAVRLIRGH